jgi:ribosomal protein L12E/L44/L45/RPP1/RPP2
MTPEIWNTLPQEVRDQGLSMMNAVNAMNVIDGFAGEAATQRAGTAAQTTTKEKKKNAEKEQQKPKKKKDNPFRGMFDR